MRLSISEVFEKMFFLFLEPPEDGDIVYDVEAAIRFEGSVSGEVRVLLSGNMAKAMVQNMLGPEENEIVTQRMEDCSKEAVNMICGDFLRRFDNTRVFSLSAPVFRERIENVEPMENACRIDLDSEGKGVGVVVELD